MPFDGVPLKRTVEQQANLLELIHDLRNLPAEWKWDYRHCSSCAYGLLQEQGKISPSVKMTAEEFLGLTPEQSDGVFCYVNLPLDLDMCEVQPHHVADKLESYL